MSVCDDCGAETVETVPGCNVCPECFAVHCDRDTIFGHPQGPCEVCHRIFLPLTNGVTYVYPREMR